MISQIGLNCPERQERLVESWNVDPLNSSTRCINRRIQPLCLDSKSSIQLPGTMFSTSITLPPSAAGTQVFQTDTNIGKTTLLPFIDGKNMMGIYHLDDDLIILKSFELQATQQSGSSSQFILHGSPSPGSRSKWTMDEWRPVYNLRTRQRIRWPQGLDDSFLTNDSITVDKCDATRVFFHGESWQSGHHFQLVKLLEDGSKTIASWKMDNISNFSRVHFGGQLFIQFDEFTIPLWLHRYKPYFTWFLDRLSTPLNQERRCVALVDELTGKVLWKQSNCELALNAGAQDYENKDFLLLKRLQMDQSNRVVTSSYECWALPILVYSPWWARGAGFVVMILAMVVFRKLARRCVTQSTSIEQTRLC